MKYDSLINTNTLNFNLDVIVCMIFLKLKRAELRQCNPQYIILIFDIISIKVDILYKNRNHYSDPRTPKITLDCYWDFLRGILNNWLDPGLEPRTSVYVYFLAISPQRHRGKHLIVSKWIREKRKAKKFVWNTKLKIALYRYLFKDIPSIYHTSEPTENQL